MKYTQQSLLAFMHNNANQTYKEFSSRLIPGETSMIGVRLPIIKILAKEISKSNELFSFLNSPISDIFELKLLYGFVVGISPIPFCEQIDYVQKIVKYIDNWSVCDSCANAFKFARSNQKASYELIRIYLSSDKEFEVRFAITMMLFHLINDEYIDTVLSDIHKINHCGYYVKMAQAWAVCECFTYYPTKTSKLLQSNNFDDFTFNKALSKICDSHCIDAETKHKIKNMKRT